MSSIGPEIDHLKSNKIWEKFLNALYYSEEVVWCNVTFLKKNIPGLSPHQKNILFPIAKVEEDKVGRLVQNFFFGP